MSCTHCWIGRRQGIATLILCRVAWRVKIAKCLCVVQNDYDELYTLLDWAVPGGLGDRQQFKAYYEDPIKMAQKKDVDDTALGRVCRTGYRS